MFKRVFDVLISASGLLVLAPVLLLLALAIKLDSPGPVFFRQERVGRRGQLFRIFKFRSMAVMPPGAGLEITVAGDPRITRIGRWMRRYKLDELPQLLDVLRGTMSLVGPRPEVPRYVAMYPPHWRERLLSVRPGITDFASVRYRNENELLARAADPEREYIEVVMPIKLRYALDHVDRPSLAQDLKVLGLTLRTVFVPWLPNAWSLVPMHNSKLWIWLDRTMSVIGKGNRARAMLVDALLILGCWHLTYLFRLGFERWQPGRPWYDDYVSVGVVVAYLLAMMVTGVPRGLWRFFGFDDFRRLAMACAAAGLVSAVVVLMLQLSGVARAVLVLHPLFSLVMLSLARMGYRMVWEAAQARIGGIDGEPRRAIIMGAGSAARRVVSAIHGRNGWSVLALLDDDPAKQGLRMSGVMVQGFIGDLVLPHVLAGATHVILAIPSATAEQRARALDLARQTGLAVMIVADQLGARSDDATTAPASTSSTA